MTLGDVVRRILGLQATPRKIARRMEQLEASATTAGVASHVSGLLGGSCPAGHSLTAHLYAIVTSVPLPASDDVIHTVFAELHREDWLALLNRFGFAPCKSLDVIAIQCPDQTIHTLAVVSAHDPYEKDVTIERCRVKDPEKLRAEVQEWDSFDRPRRVAAAMANK